MHCMLNYCKDCGVLTHHIDSVCQRCKKDKLEHIKRWEESLGDYWEDAWDEDWNAGGEI